MYARIATYEDADPEAVRAAAEQLFWVWEIYRHTGDRRDLKLAIRTLRRDLKPILRHRTFLV